MSSKTKAWIEAFRLRTLPLALSCIGMGSFIAASLGTFKIEVLLLCVLTTLFLQILSNLANDYGDAVSGVDSSDREGPKRMVQTGLITKPEMKKALIVFSVLSLASGIGLLVVALGDMWKLFGLFMIIGIAAIYAAIKYTAGKNPYGYAGLGDISVFIFFGLVGVAGSFYLHAQFFNPTILLPAATCGFFAVAVLNLNNIRDIQSDKAAGKRSIPVRIGRTGAVYYHWALLALGFMASLLYVLLNYQSIWQFSMMLIIPLLIVNARAVVTKKDAMELDPYLKQMALSTLLFVVIFGISQIVA